MLADDRFAYDRNVVKASSYHDRRSPFWPPSRGYNIIFLDLSDRAPVLDTAFFSELSALRSAITEEWETAKLATGRLGRRRFHNARPIADCLRRIAQLIPAALDQKALMLRADAVEFGYDDEKLSALASINEEVAVVAGQLATWYGKQTGGLPTAFACAVDDERQRLVTAASEAIAAVPAYLGSLRAGLQLGSPPAFVATSLFFMAGEGNYHPKHIAYFLPEDEGVKRSPYKKTYYFANTHLALLTAVSCRRFERFVDIGSAFAPAAANFAAIPTLSVFAHELGHFVHGPATSFSSLNEANRWVSVVLQETAADVFGTLIVAEILAERFRLNQADVIAYYLAECLRYVDRGLGYFPDSDGMFLQLAYFVRVGALRLETNPAPRLVGDPSAVLAGLRSLARVLADALLSGGAERAIALHRLFGPGCRDPLGPVLDELGRGELTSVEYLQEHIREAPLAVGAAA